MTDQNEGKKSHGRLRKVALWGAGVTLLVIAALYLLLNVVLNTPQATGRISRLLSETLHQPTTVGGLNIAGGTVFIHNLTIFNPPGFNGGNLLFARTITVTPSWSGLLAGRKSFTAIGIRGVKLTLVKNSAGTWNFSGLKELFGKKSTGETFIRRLVLENSAVSVNGSGITDISLAINNFSTKGSTDSGILLTFNDDFGSPYRLEGGARLGVKPSLDLSLSSPSISFKALRKFKLPLDPEKGKGKLLLKARMHGDEFKLDANAAFDRLTLLLKGEDVPLSGNLDFSAAYDVKEDAATLERCVLQVDRLINLKARGRMERIKKERAFTAEVSHDGMEVKNLFALLPQKLRRDLEPGGTVLPGSLRVSGSVAAGVASGQATFALRHGRLGKGGRMLAEEIAADAVLARENSGWGLSGKVFQQEKNAGIPLNLSNIPITASFSDRFHPLKAGLPSFSASINGIQVKGDAAYQADAPAPLTYRLEVPEVPLAVLSRSFPAKNMTVTKGSVTASIRGSGRVPGEIRGDIIARVSNLQGTYAGKKLALADLSTRAAASFNAGKIAAAGSLKAAGGLYDGKKVAASFAYRLADGLVTLNGGDCAIDLTHINFTEISAAIPKGLSANNVPVNLRFTGIRCRQDDSGFDGLSGNLNATLVSDAGGRRLEGDGAVNTPSLIYKGKGVGSLAARLVLAKGKGTVAVTGKVLGGDLTVSANGDPFAAERKAAFTLSLAGAQGAGLADVLGKDRPVRVSGGVLAVSGTGDYSVKNGPACRMVVTGSDLALTGKNGKVLLTDGGLRLDGEWGGGNLQLREGKITVGKEPAVSLRGSISQAASAKRDGQIALVLPKVSLTALFDAFANILPRSLQEATSAGNMAMDGKLRFKGKQTALTGEMTLEGGSLENPGQKLSIAAINGVIPFSIDFSGTAASKPPEKISFSRENYPRLLEAMQQPVIERHVLTIGKIRYGTTEFGATTLAIRAGNGLTEISSLTSGLFQGALLGRGFFRYQGGAQFGADILVHDLSLREVCNTYPAIKGYLSGLVDGFVSIYGTDKGLKDIKGLVALWTLSSKNEKMLVSKEFLQKLAGKDIKGMFFQSDRPFDRGEIGAFLEGGDLTFETLDISHTNFLGIRDLSVTVAPVQNRIGLDHLLTTIREAASRGKAAAGAAPAPAEKPAGGEFKWEE